MLPDQDLHEAVADEFVQMSAGQIVSRRTVTRDPVSASNTGGGNEYS